MSTRSSAISHWATLLCMLVLPLGAFAGDSGVGVDTQLGNKLFPTGKVNAPFTDARGTSWLISGTHRTPTGFLYPPAFEPPQYDRLDDNWWERTTLEVGALQLSGDTRNMLWDRYADWGNGLIVGIDTSLVRPEDGSYLDLRGSYLSPHNQFYKLRAGRYGSWRMDLFARVLPNVVSDNTQSIWNGVGTDTLTLKSGLTPGASTPAQVAAVSAAQAEQRLQVKRTKEGLDFNYFFDRRWTGYLDLTNEERKGARPFGGPFFFNYAFPADGGILETIKPIDDGTVNVNFGARYMGSTWRMDFGYSGSFYRDRINAFDYQMPFALYPAVSGATSALLTQGEFSSEPDNDYHNLRATLTRVIPLNGEISVTGSASTTRQNDSLLAPTNCAGTFGIELPGPVDPLLFPCSDWNTTAALPRSHAGLRLDTAMVDTTVVLQPGAFTWRGEVKYYREDYQGDYLAYNPLTGQYGYVSENGSQGSVVPGEVGIFDTGPANSSSITRVRNLLLDKTVIEGNAGVDWRLTPKDTIGTSVAYRRYEPDHRERSQVDDTTFKANWSNRMLEWLNVRLNYTYLSRTGDLYNYDPYDFTYSMSLPGFVAPAGGVPAHTVDAMRKYDISSRHEHKADLMLTFIPQETMTLSASLRGDWNDYAADIGRSQLNTYGATLQWEWQPSPDTVASLLGAYEHSTLHLTNVNELVTDNPDPSLGGATYPFSGLWWAANKERHYTFGAHVSQNVHRVRIDANWNYQYSRGLENYAFASPLALAFPDVAPIAGDTFPALTYRVNSFTLGATWRISQRLSARLFDYYEHADISDWHYAGFDTTRVYDHRVYSDGGPSGYSTNLVGLSFSYTL